MEVDRKSYGSVMASFDAFLKESGLPVRWAVSEQLRLMLKDLVSSKVPIPKQKKIGKSAVNQGLSSVVAPILPHSMIFPGQAGHVEIVTGTTQFKVPSEMFEPTAGPERLLKIHNRQRKKGRTPRGNEWARSKHGKMTVVNKTFSRRARYRKARVARMKRVGAMKKGFYAAILQLDREVNATTKVPAWVRKANLTYPPGRVRIGLDITGTGNIVAFNNVSYASRRYGGWIEFFQYKRERDIYGPFRKRIDRMTERFNAGRM